MYNNNSYSDSAYSDSYLDDMSPIDPTILQIIGIALFVLGIVLIVFLYIKYLGKNSDRSTKMGRLLHFDHFYIEQFLRILYLIFAVLVPVFLIFAVIAATAMFGPRGLVGGLIAFIILVPLFEFLHRLLFENAIIYIRQAIDVRSLRMKVVGDIQPEETPSAPSQKAPREKKKRKKKGEENSEAAANTAQPMNVNFYTPGTAGQPQPFQGAPAAQYPGQVPAQQFGGMQAQQFGGMQPQVRQQPQPGMPGAPGIAGPAGAPGSPAQPFGAQSGFGAQQPFQSGPLGWRCPNCGNTAQGPVCQRCGFVRQA